MENLTTNERENILHLFGNINGCVVNDYETLFKFIHSMQKDLLTKPVAPLFEGETIDAVDNVDIVLTRLRNNIGKLALLQKAIQQVNVPTQLKNLK